MVAKRVVVIGAGIIGASIAYHLTRGGAAVTVVEAGSPGGVATAASFAWINASWGNPEPYFRLRRRAMAEWPGLAAEVPGLGYRRCGGLCWDLPPDGLAAYAREHGSWGYGVRTVGSDEMRRIEPALTAVPEVALYVEEEAAAEPDNAARALATAAEAGGARLLRRCEVLALSATGGRVDGVITASGRLDADEVVVAAGVATPGIAATAGVRVPLQAPPGLLAHAGPTDRLLNGLVLADKLHMRQTADGCVVIGSDFGGSDPGVHAQGTAEALIAQARTMLSGGERLTLQRYTIGLRPTPEDGFPVIGRAGGIEGLYLAVTHSGVTLAPAIGQFAAEELLDGREEPLLSRYRLARFGAA